MTRQEADVYAFLDRYSIEYTLAHHERVATMEECRLPMQLLQAVVPRNIFLTPKNQSSYWLLLAHPDSVFRTASISRQVASSRLSFAPEDKVSELLGAYPGAISPLGLIYDSENRVQLLIDEKLLSEPFLIFHPLDNTASVKISVPDFTERFLPACRHTYTAVQMETHETDKTT